MSIARPNFPGQRSTAREDDGIDLYSIKDFGRLDIPAISYGCICEVSPALRPWTGGPLAVRGRVAGRGGKSRKWARVIYYSPGAWLQTRRLRSWARAAQSRPENVAGPPRHNERAGAQREGRPGQVPSAVGNHDGGAASRRAATTLRRSVGEVPRKKAYPESRKE